MKIFGDYLRRHLGGIGILLACCGIFVLVFSLYDLPAEAVLYGGVLSAVLYLFWFLVRFRKYYQKCRTLRQMQQEIVITTRHLPPPEDASEQAYQELVELLYQKQQELTQEWRVRYSDMMEYYTAWTHQMKTPIAAMHLLLQEEETPVSKELQGELFQVEQYVQMALQYLRMERMNTDLVFEKQELDALIHQAVRKYAPLFIRRKIALQYEDVHCQILTDEKWLEFVLEQVLSNALKYTRKGKIKIYMDPQSPKTLVIEDTGIGIAPEDLPRVFERGYTGYNGRTDKRSTGIGLYLCRQIMDRLSHTIRIESEMGVGTRVYLGLDTMEL